MAPPYGYIYISDEEDLYNNKNHNKHKANNTAANIICDYLTPMMTLLTVRVVVSIIDGLAWAVIRASSFKWAFINLKL